MRISAGNLKGRKLSSAKALRLAKKRDELRPTSSKVKESIFNIVGEKIKGTEFVDLYSGTGAVGIEALSRGASAVSFVEADRKRAELIKEMLKDCGCFERAEIIKSKAADFIKKAAGDNSKFDIIFL
ncbi:MAG TPA: 16S rRNA (guanine(966)-N(2))-methyltransferase RsmD, partial [Nitrospiraceae bacterium]|nr:16S rRNA (guanine(966)-N(2))-methyltransferase RsmD [Nitrospiraceae bacterium]